MNDKSIPNKEHPLDAWFFATPEDPYDLCPCKCGQKFRFVMRDEKTLEEHKNKFIENYLNPKKKDDGIILQSIINLSCSI